MPGAIGTLCGVVGVCLGRSGAGDGVGLGGTGGLPRWPVGKHASRDSTNEEMSQVAPTGASYAFRVCQERVGHSVVSLARSLVFECPEAASDWAERVVFRVGR